MQTNKRNIFSWPRLLAICGLGILVFLSTMRPLGAQQVTKGYAADQPLERGMLVRLSPDDSAKIQPLKADEASFLHGVTVAPNDSPITLSSEDAQVFVATAGRYEVLISNQNGNVKAGDYIGISSAEGIAMKASDELPTVVGKALDGFDGRNPVGSAEVNGRTVQYSRVLTEISIGPNPWLNTQTPFLPGFLSQSAENIGGKPVSTPRVYIALVTVMATMLVSGSIIYGGIRSSITAVGRNPLARAMVGKSLLKVVVIGLFIFVGGLFTVYLTLRI